jgi:hypothetical protein
MKDNPTQTEDLAATNTMTQYFTEANTWFGGYYELALELGIRSDERLLAALAAVWSDPDLDGAYLSWDIEPSQQQRLAITAELLQIDHLQGLAQLPHGPTIACGTCIIREDNGPDWLVLYLPMGALGTAYPIGGYPFEPEMATSRQWRDALDPWLASIGIRVYDQVVYRLGLIGFEVSGEIYADGIAANGVPARHYPGLLWPSAGAVTYYPSTE